MFGFTPFYGTTGLYSQPLAYGASASFSNPDTFGGLLSTGFAAAFGADANGNLPPGPIQNVVNQLASQMNGSNLPQLASVLPATDPFQAQYYGPPNPMTAWGVPDQFQLLGLSNPNPLAALLTSSWSIPGFGATPTYAGQHLPLNNPLEALRLWGHTFVSPYIQP